MGDMADAFNELKAYRKEQKKERLSVAKTDGWHKHSEYHYSKVVDNEKLQWWPSTVKAMYKNKMYYGYRAVTTLFKRLGI